MREGLSLTHFFLMVTELAVHRALRRVVHRTLLAETTAVTLAGVSRFQFRLLAGRDEVSMFFKIFNDLFADHFALKTPQSALDRFVRVNINKSHISSHLLSAEISPVRANNY